MGGRTDGCGGNREARRCGSDWRVSYQSRVWSVRGLSLTPKMITHAGKEGTSLIVVPIAPRVGAPETLVELDIEYRELAEEAGVPKYKRVGTVDCDAAFIAGMQIHSHRFE